MNIFGAKYPTYGKKGGYPHFDKFKKVAKKNEKLHIQRERAELVFDLKGMVPIRFACFLAAVFLIYEVYGHHRMLSRAVKSLFETIYY